MTFNFSPSGVAQDPISSLLVPEMSKLSLQSEKPPERRRRVLSHRRQEAVNHIAQTNTFSFGLSSQRASARNQQSLRPVSPRVSASPRLPASSGLMVLPTQRELLSAKIFYLNICLDRIASFLFAVPKTAEDALHYFEQDGIGLYLTCKTINRKMCEVTREALSFLRKEGIVERMVIENRAIPRFFRQTVVHLSFSNIDFSLIANAQALSIFKLARSFPNTSELSLRSCKMQQAHLELLDNFSKLRVLKIYEDDAVTDEGIKALQSVFKPLKKLVLFGCPNITDDAVKTVATYARNITSLSLAYSNITTLEDVSKMVLLNDFLFVGCLKIKQMMLAHLSKCGLLKSVDFSRSPLSDQGLVHLAKIALLKELFLNNCKPVLEGFCCWKIDRKITFNGVSSALLGHKHLQTLQVNGIEATPQEIESLQKRFSEKVVKEPDPQKKPVMTIYNRRNERSKRHVYMAPADQPKNRGPHTKAVPLQQPLVGNLT